MFVRPLEPGQPFRIIVAFDYDGVNTLSVFFSFSSIIVLMYMFVDGLFLLISIGLYCKQYFCDHCAGDDVILQPNILFLNRRTKVCSLWCARLADRMCGSLLEGGKRTVPDYQLSGAHTHAKYYCSCYYWHQTCSGLYQLFVDVTQVIERRKHSKILMAYFIQVKSVIFTLHREQ